MATHLSKSEKIAAPFSLMRKGCPELDKAICPKNGLFTLFQTAFSLAIACGNVYAWPFLGQYQGCTRPPSEPFLASKH